MNAADEGDRLPRSIGGLIGFALTGWAANAALYFALALGVFVAYAVAEYVVPAAATTTPQGAFKLVVLEYTGLFADAFVVAAVALGIAARGAGATISPRTLAGAATERWLPVIAVTFLAQSIVGITYAFSGLIPAPEPRALVFLTAPPTYVLWGILGLTGPFVALSANRAALSVIFGFGHAFTASLHRSNLLRLCIVAAVTVLPMVLETILQNALIAHKIPRAIFWGNAPLDALVIGPLAAMQTAFALDFARRAGRLERPR